MAPTPTNSDVRKNFIQVVTMFNFKPVPAVSKEFRTIYALAKPRDVDFFTIAEKTSDEHMNIMHFIETAEALEEYPDFVNAFDEYAEALGMYCTNKMDKLGLHGL